MYGCLYTALTPAGVIAEHAKQVVERALSRPRDLVALEVLVDPVFDVVTWAEMLTGRRERHPEAEGWRWPPPTVSPASLVGDTTEDLEACRTLADWARNEGYLGLHASSAADQDERVLAIYPENVPQQLDVQMTTVRLPLNYGDDPVLDTEGRPRVALEELMARCPSG